MLQAVKTEAKDWSTKYECRHAGSRRSNGKCDLSNFQELKKIEKEKGKETKGTETQEKALWPQRRSVFPPRIWLPLSWLLS